MGDILSQNEIDSLLSALTQGEPLQQNHAQVQDKAIKEYKFRNPTKFAKDHINTLKIINDTYARLLQNFLQGYLRAMVQIDVFEVQPMAYFEYNNSIANPAVLAVIDFQPLNGSIIMELSPYIAFALVDRILGGAGTAVDKLRNFTEIENAILERLINQMLNLMREPWENVLAVRPRLEKIENNAQFAKIISENETVALITFKAKIGEAEGMINVCIPYIVIEPIVPKLSTKLWFSRKEKESTKETRDTIEVKIENTKVPLKAILGQTTILVSDFIELQPGDVLPLDSNINGDLDILVGDILKFRAQPGVRKNKLSAKITEVIREEEG